MALTQTDIKYIVKTPGIVGGRARIDGTRIPVELIATYILQLDTTVEELVEGYEHVPLTPAQIHAAMAYYYDHQDEIDEEIRITSALTSEGIDRQARREAGRISEEVTAEEAAAILGVSHESRQVAKLCRKGYLDGRKVANRWVIKKDSVMAYAEGYRKPGRKPSD